MSSPKLNGLEPHAWLKSVLTRLPEGQEDRFYELLPLAENTLTD